MSWISVLGRSPGEGNVYPLQFSCLESSMERGAWWGTVCGCREMDTAEWLSHSWFFLIIHLFIHSTSICWGIHLMLLLFNWRNWAFSVRKIGSDLIVCKDFYYGIKFRAGNCRRSSCAKSELWRFIHRSPLNLWPYPKRASVGQESTRPSRK